MDSTQNGEAPPPVEVVPPERWQPFTEPPPVSARQARDVAILRANYEVGQAEEEMRRAVEYRETKSVALWWAAVEEHQARVALAAAREALHALQVPSA